jgi:hypothetical protein
LSSRARRKAGEGSAVAVVVILSEDGRNKPRSRVKIDVQHGKATRQFLLMIKKGVSSGFVCSTNQKWLAAFRQMERPELILSYRLELLNQ